MSNCGVRLRERERVREQKRERKGKRKGGRKGRNESIRLFSQKQRGTMLILWSLGHLTRATLSTTGTSLRHL